MIRVLIADDHAIVRQGLRQILAGESDLTIEGEAATGEELLTMVRRGGGDVVILDLSLPGMAGLDVLRELGHLSPDLPVLILSVHAADQYATRALRAGAAGYLTKEAAPEELVVAIRRVVAGGRYLGTAEAELLADYVASGRAERPHEALSDREFEIMQLLVRGRRVTDIAETLKLSPKTVSTYRRRVLEKMNMTSNADLVDYAVREGLIDPDAGR
jgi:DNA-binding NarL/FixJ family response regulator